MLISLSEIMNTKSGVRKIIVPIELNSFQTKQGDYAFYQKDSVTLILTNLGSRRVQVNAESEVILKVPCDRCLEEVLVPVKIDFLKEIDFNETEEERAEDLDEANYVIGHDLDMDKLIYEEILLGFPMKILCKDDCKGICRVGGSSLNFGECGCDRVELDPRMSAIRDIFNNFKEV